LTVNSEWRCTKEFYVIVFPAMRKAILTALSFLLLSFVPSGVASTTTRSSSKPAPKKTGTKASSSGRTSTGTCKSSSDVHVKGHTKKNGTQVKPYTRTAPNGTKSDNFSTKGNVNPYTGKKGTKKPTN